MALIEFMAIMIIFCLKFVVVLFFTNDKLMYYLYDKAVKLKLFPRFWSMLMEQFRDGRYNCIWKTFGLKTENKMYVCVLAFKENNTN